MPQFPVGETPIKFNSSVSTTSIAITKAILEKEADDKVILFISSKNQNGDINKRILGEPAVIKGKTMKLITMCSFIGINDEATFDLAVKNSTFEYELFDGANGDQMFTAEITKSFDMRMAKAEVIIELV